MNLYNGEQSMTLALNVQNRNYLLDPKVMYTLGRGEGVDILVKHAMVSRRHCRFFFQDGHWILEDLGSAHGTFLSGVKIKETEISVCNRINNSYIH